MKCSLAAAAAKLLQLCPTLCDPIDGSPPGSPIPGILQARTLEWVAISFSNASKWKVKVKSLSRVRPSATPWTAAFQAPPSMGFSRQEYLSGVPLPYPKNTQKNYTEEVYKKDLHDPDNHDGMITHLEPDILECEVKWALESITTKKASEGDGIPVELFQILKDDAVKVLHSICQQIWKTQHWPQDWKSQFSFQSQRKAMPKNAKLPHNCTHLTH